MRKVVALESVSLDGVMESLENGSFHIHNDEMEEANASGMAAADAIVPASPTARPARSPARAPSTSRRPGLSLMSDGSC
jgi:hypothetical protein